MKTYVSSVDDVEDTRRNTGLHGKFSQADRAARVNLRGLHNEGVTSGDGNWEHLLQSCEVKS